MNLLPYINGRRTGKEAHRIEYKAMKDSFLADALEGYERVSGNHSATIIRMKRKMHKRVRKTQHITWIAAASLLILLSVGYYYFMITEKNGELISQEITNRSKPFHNLYSEEISESTDYINSIENKSVAIADKEIGVDLGNSIVKNESSDAKEIENSTTVKLASKTKAVRGKVTDEYGEAIIGASIRQKGTEKGTVTDSIGNFSLPIDDDLNETKLNINYIGYEPVEVAIAGNDNMLIAMHENENVLSEVVVTDAASKKRKFEKATVSNVRPTPTMGYSELNKFLKNNVKQPSDAACAQTKGKVVLSFYVDESGKPCKIQVKKSLCTSADQAAIDLLLSAGLWTLGNLPCEIEVIFSGK
ncbi:MAG: carboxypeptidase-like regulatory domain-containing protein [Bacteroidales bacterium]|jgi:hypothetical protein|nr:carboxypeptidase-like regulatory domain-containing protein [Bacteroidales bacterium]